MYLREKVENINKKLKVLEKDSNIVIWGAGMHTNKLFEMTDILSYNLQNIVDIDERKHGNSYFGFTIKYPGEIRWDCVESVVISVPNKEKEIADLLIQETSFSGDIITIYEKGEITPFYKLDNDKMGISYLGDYDSWEAACIDCKGYEDENILNRVINATTKVLNGDAVWEREGTLFYEPKYVYHICASILKSAIQNKNQGVRILDIGGALGSTYFQNRKYLSDVNNLEYVVAEQDNYADYGHKNVENAIIKFIRSSDDWENHDRFDIILLSGSLQYIYQYKEIIAKIIKAKPRYIILDRIMVSDRMRICRQIIPGSVLESKNSWSYPVRIFGEDEVLQLFGEAYKVVERDISCIPEEAYFMDGKADARWYVFENIS